MTLKLNICTFNFADTSGIKDYIYFFQNNLKDRFSVKISKQIDKNAINIFIDDFHNQNSVKYLKKKKSENPNLRLAIVLTEFFNNNVQTLNHFEFQEKPPFDFIYKSISLVIRINNIIEKIFTLAFTQILFDFLLYVPVFFVCIFTVKYVNNFYYCLVFKIVPSKISFIKQKLMSLIKYLLLILLSPLILVLNIKDILKFNFIKSFYIFIQKNRFLKFNIFIHKLRSQASNIIYFKKRYNGLKEVIMHFDEIFYSHPDIKKTIDRKIFTINAKLEKNLIFCPKNLSFFPSKNNIFYFSGELTPYRSKIFDNLKKKNNSCWSKLTYNLNNSIYGTYHTDGLDRKFCFSLNPRKNSEWPYSSPTRYYRSLEQKEIPIVFDKFNDYTKLMTVHISKDKFYINKILGEKKKIFNLLKNKLKNLKKLSDKFKKELVYYYSV
jgi:hypothetical protein